MHYVPKWQSFDLHFDILNTFCIKLITNIMVFKYIFFIFLISFVKAAMRLNHEYARVVDNKHTCPDKLKITYFNFHKHNRTTKALSVNFTLFQDIMTQHDLEIRSRFFLWKNNEYKRTPITWSMFVCSFLDKGNFAIHSLLADSSIKKCPIKQGNHYIRNISPPDLEGWPSIIPEGRWKLSIDYYFEGKNCADIEWVASIIKPKK